MPINMAEEWERGIDWIVCDSLEEAEEEEETEDVRILLSTEEGREAVSRNIDPNVLKLGKKDVSFSIS